MRFVFRLMFFNGHSRLAKEGGDHVEDFPKFGICTYRKPRFKDNLGVKIVFGTAQNGALKV